MDFLRERALKMVAKCLMQEEEKAENSLLLKRS